MLKNFNNYNMNETLKLIQEIYEENKIFFIKMHKSKNIYRFLFNHSKIKIYTYVLVKNDKVLATCLYIYDKHKDGLPLFCLSYAVEEKYRNKGLCTELISKSMDYLFHELKTKIYQFYIVTYVSMDNTISQKLSKRFISKNKTVITDSMTGEKQYEYLKLFKC